jgi:hypothetical protein
MKFIFSSPKSALLLSLALVSFATMANGSTDERLGCAAQINGYYFNLHDLSKPINSEDRLASEMYTL